MAVFYHGGGGSTKVVPCTHCSKPMYHNVHDPTTPVCDSCRKAKTYGKAVSLTSPPYWAPERPSQARDEAQDDSEPQPTCQEHPGDYGPMCALCDDDRARYRGWRRECEICFTYEPNETFRVGAVILELCDSCILLASKEIKRMSRERQARAEARNKEPGHERQT